MSNNQPMEIVIVGLGAGGLYSSKSALSYNRKSHVTIIEKRNFDQFSPCGLPFVIEGVVEDFDELKYNVPEVKNRLSKLLFHKVVSVDAERKIVKALDLATSQEKEIKYDSLILATGASPIILGVPGAKELAGRGVHFVSDIGNSKALLQAAKSSSKKKAVVVGGGSIGLEIAVGLKKLGLDVAVTKKSPPPFPRNLEPSMGSIIVEHLERLGIRVLFGKGINRINGKHKVEFVEIAAENIDCDIVVMAVGMKANTRIAELAGARTERKSVVVNNRMETSVKDVYAVGDLVQTYSRIDGTPTIMQLATSAYRQGMAAGINAAGGNSSYPGALNTFVTVIGGLEIASTGYTLEIAKSLGYEAKAFFTKREIKPHYMPDAEEIRIGVIVESSTGKILGAQAVGKEGAAWRINLFALAIHGGMTLYDIMDAELAYNPPVSQMYDPVSQVAEIALKRLRLPAKECKKILLGQSLIMKSKNILIPARLKPGDKVGIAAPASPFDMENYNLGVHVLESMGLCVCVLDDIFDKNTYLAGPDVHRANLLNKLFADSSIKAIICARGGYGSIRILPLLDYNIIRNNPKIFVGFSDVSAILSAIYIKCGLVTFHGPMVTTIADASQKTKESMMAAFFSDSKLKITIKNGITLRHGSASGVVSGGNLATLCHLAGTPFQPSFKGHILFLEDRGEAAYKIDRMLTQMKMAGCFEGIAGLVLGFFEDCGKITEIFSVVDNIFKDDDIPVLAGLEAGHGRNNITIPFGITATLDSDRSLLSFHEVATS